MFTLLKLLINYIQHFYKTLIMIDENHQDKGYGKEALLKAIEYIKTKPHGPSKVLSLSFVPGNDKAEDLYKKVGFVATGEVDEGEILMRLDI